MTFQTISKFEKDKVGSPHVLRPKGTMQKDSKKTFLEYNGGQRHTPPPPLPRGKDSREKTTRVQQGPKGPPPSKQRE